MHAILYEGLEHLWILVSAGLFEPMCHGYCRVTDDDGGSEKWVWVKLVKEETIKHSVSCTGNYF